jgi:acyl-CoA reductase-like NAD-dependent aldehyde dehydrogenase
MPETRTARDLAGNERRSAELLDRRWGLLIDGEVTGAHAGRTFDVLSPFTGEKIAEVPDADRADVDRAVIAAEAAFPAWAALPAAERGAYLLRLADAIEEQADDFAILDATDGGAPVSIMRLDVQIALDSLRYYAGVGLEAKGYTVRASENLHYTELFPYGVVAKIIPFNHPFMFAASKIAAPLMAGNTVVVKPAETTPLSALLLGELAREILPRSVLSIVVGDGPEVPDALVRHPRIRRIGFTGSIAVGKAIQRAAAEVGVKHVTLELGGKNVLLAYPDADPDAVAAGVIAGMNFTWSGQSCGSTSRLLVHEAIADEVLARVKDRLAEWDWRSPLDPDCRQGTMVSRRQYDRVLDFIAGARAAGARVVTGGGAPSGQRGLFIEPTFLDGVDPSFAVASEEIFGPVVSVLRWTDEQNAIGIANALEYGLTGSIYTNDVRTAHRAARALDSGFIWINGSSRHFQGLPYGGWKDSGLGSEEGFEELTSYLRSKSVTVML